MKHRWAWLAAALLLGCSPVGGGGSSSPGPGTGSDATGGTTGGFGADGQGGVGQLAIFVGDQGLVTSDVYVLPALLPSPDAEARVRIQIANLGASELNLNKVSLLPLNKDGSPPNAFVELLWGDLDPATAFPYPLTPHGVDQTAFFEVELIFRPLGADSNNATLAIESDDPVLATRTLVFVAPGYAPKVDVKPDEGVFWYADLSESEVKTFEIHNEGLGLLHVTGIALDQKETRYWLVGGPEYTGSVKPKGSAGYAPMTFEVGYQPIFGVSGETANVLITTDDPVTPDYKLPLLSKFETDLADSPCVWSVPGGQGDTLDFSDVLSGQKTVTLTMSNVGSQVCNVMGFEVANDPNGVRYVVQMEIPGKPDQDPPVPAQPVAIFPVGISAGNTLNASVTYKAEDAGFDTEITIDYQDPLPRQLVLTAIGGANKPCLEYVPIVDGAPLAMEFVGAPSAGVSRKFVIRSCGEGTLTIANVTIVDDVNPALPSVYWAVTSPGATSIKVAPGAWQPFDVLMTIPGEDGIALEGTMDLVWTDGISPRVTSVGLTAKADSAAVLPVANTGPPDAYVNLVAGEAILLDGTSSQPGTAEQVLDTKSYLWFLMSRPANSEVELEAKWGGASRFMVADVPGAYTLGLMVRTAGEAPLTSALAQLDFTVGEAP